MRKRFRFLVSVTAISLVTFFSSGALRAQQTSPDFDLRFSQDFNYSWDFTGGGARAAGMGNAFTAVADDPFSLSWNPAGLTGLDEIYMSFDWMDFVPSGSFDFNGLQTVDHSGSSSNFFRNAAIVAPLVINKQKFVLGGGVTRHFETFETFTDKIFPHLSSPGERDLTSVRQGFLNSANLGMGTAVSEKLSLGVTGNIYFGRMIIDQSRTETYLTQRDPNRFNQLLDITREVRQLDSMNFSGFNVNFGATYQIGDRTTIGLSVRSPFEITLSDDIKLDRLVTENGAVVSSGITSSDTLLWADQESKIEMPLMVTFGLAHKLSEKLLMSLDLEYRGFSGSDLLLLDSTTISQSGTKETFFRNEPANWSNVLQIRIGSEYTMNSSIGDIPIRAGFGYLPQPFSDVEDYSFRFNGRLDPTLPLSRQATGTPIFEGSDDAFKDNQDVDLFLDSFGDQVSAINFSLGIGLHSDQRALDIAYTFTSYTQQLNSSSVRVLNPAYDPATTTDASPFLENGTRNSETSVRDHRFIVSFTGYF